MSSGMVMARRTIQAGIAPVGAGGVAGQTLPNLSPAVVSGLTTAWQCEYERRQRRDLLARP